MLFYEQNFCQVTSKSEQNEIGYDENLVHHMYDFLPQDINHKGNVDEGILNQEILKIS